MLPNSSSVSGEGLTSARRRKNSKMSSLLQSPSTSGIVYRPAGLPISHCAARTAPLAKIAAVFGEVGEGQPLVVGEEMHRVIARDAAAAQACKADGANAALAGDAVAPALAVVRQRDPAALRRRFAQQQRGARWRIDFHAVVRLDDLDVPVLAQPAGGLAHQMGQQGDAERGVAGLQHGDALCGVIAQEVVALLKPGGADHDRHAGRARRVEIGLQRVGAGEIDQHVAAARQRQRIAALVDAAGMDLARGGNRLHQRPPHAPFAADNADACHCKPPNSSERRAFRSGDIEVGRSATSSSSPAQGSAPRAASTPSARKAGCGNSTGWRTSRRRRPSSAIPTWCCASTTCAARRSRPSCPMRRTRRWGGWMPSGKGELLIVTQNIDDLHERGGARRVLHMHGEHLNAWCTWCDVRSPWRGTADRPAAMPGLRCAGLAPRCRLVRRDALPDGRDLRGACAAATCSSRSALRARSIPPPDSCARRAIWARRRWSSTWNGRRDRPGSTRPAGPGEPGGAGVGRNTLALNARAAVRRSNGFRSDCATMRAHLKQSARHCQGGTFDIGHQRNRFLAQPA